MGSSFGQLFRITTWGESHGGGVGVVIDGCPPRLELSEEDIQRDLDRRRPGQSEIVTPRGEAGPLSNFIRRFRGPDAGHSNLDPGEEQGCAAGSLLGNESGLPAVARRLHLQAKYGVRNWQGGGRASARETVGRVAAGAVAKKLLRKTFARTLRNCRVRNSNSRSVGASRSNLRRELKQSSATLFAVRMKQPRS